MGSTKPRKKQRPSSRRHVTSSHGRVASDGTLVPVQPLIAPLFGGLTELEVLARLAGAEETDPYKIARATFESIAGEATASGTNFYTMDFWQQCFELGVR